MNFTIRPLEWAKNWKGGDFPPYFHIGTAGTNKEAVEERWYFKDARFIWNNLVFGTLDEAKAAAQADYESRIRSALSAPAERGVEEPVAWAYKMAHGVDALRKWSDFREHISLTKPITPDGSPDCIRDVRPLYAAPSPPAGMVMVPREVLDRLMLAFARCRENDGACGPEEVIPFDGPATLGDVWAVRSAIAAAPGQPAQGMGREAHRD